MSGRRVTVKTRRLRRPTPVLVCPEPCGKAGYGRRAILLIVRDRRRQGIDVHAYEHNGLWHITGKDEFDRAANRTRRRTQVGAR